MALLVLHGFLHRLTSNTQTDTAKARRKLQNSVCLRNGGCVLLDCSGDSGVRIRLRCVGAYPSPCLLCSVFLLAVAQNTALNSSRYALRILVLPIIVCRPYFHEWKRRQPCSQNAEWISWQVLIQRTEQIQRMLKDEPIETLLAGSTRAV